MIEEITLRGEVKIEGRLFKYAIASNSNLKISPVEQFDILLKALRNSLVKRMENPSKTDFELGLTD